MATEVINSVENAYLRQNVESRSAEAQQSLEFLGKQLPDLKERVEAAQAKLNRLSATARNGGCYRGNIRRPS